MEAQKGGTPVSPDVQSHSASAGRSEVFATSALFLDLHAEEISLLASLCQEMRFRAGDLIFREGDVGESLYIIHEGAIDVVRNLDHPATEQVVATLRAGDFFGEMGMLEREVRSASTRARDNSVVLVLTTEDIYSFARLYRNGFSVVIINIAKVLSKRLRQTLDRLHELHAATDHPK